MEDRVRGLVGPELLKRFRLDGDERPTAAPTVEAIAAAAGSGGRASPDELVARHADGARFDPLSECERILRCAHSMHTIASFEANLPWSFE